VEQLQQAEAVAPIVSVQNRYNMTERVSDPVLAYCAQKGIAFIPWAPLADGPLTRAGGLLDRIAHDHQATQGQVALAWLLQRSPVMLPIPGTSKVAHLEENIAAAALRLRPEEVTALDQAAG
jgi:aryl-alcohol dehydrogenase-like predicted oxidoreductase